MLILVCYGQRDWLYGQCACGLVDKKRQRASVEALLVVRLFSPRGFMSNGIIQSVPTCFIMRMTSSVII
jgi:hypothetical protein